MTEVDGSAMSAQPFVIGFRVQQRVRRGRVCLAFPPGPRRWRMDGRGLRDVSKNSGGR
jgi:hypothetical protein